MKAKVQAIGRLVRDAANVLANENGSMIVIKQEKTIKEKNK